MADVKVGFPAVSYVTAGDKQIQRAHAVAAALELIAIRTVGNGIADSVERELNKLSSYADQIQKALEVK